MGLGSRDSGLGDQLWLKTWALAPVVRDHDHGGKPVRGSLTGAPAAPWSLYGASGGAPWSLFGAPGGAPWSLCGAPEVALWFLFGDQHFGTKLWSPFLSPGLILSSAPCGHFCSWHPRAGDVSLRKEEVAACSASPSDPGKHVLPCERSF